MQFDDSTVDVPRSAAAAPKPERRVSLVIYHRDGMRVVPLADDTPLEIGRRDPADVVIPETTLSRRHARFYCTEGVMYVEDLDSTNGTWVNGKRIKRAPIKVTDEIALGSVSVSLHIVTPAAAQLYGLDNYDRFQTLLEHEVDRARTFGRKLGLLMIQSIPGSAQLLDRWCPRIRALLRAVDRIGLYGPGTAEILLPEADLEQAMRLATAIVEERKPSEPTLLCGIAIFPENATSTEALVDVCRKALRRAATSRRVQVATSPQQRQQTIIQPQPGGPVIRSAAMRDVFDTIDRLAPSLIPVLIVGETGVGKEVIAQAIHERGPRCEQPLLSVNCGALPEQLIESALFGHQRGAFTGAERAAPGVFVSAAGGTVFLDEIGELSQSAQVALLRVLETKRVVPVGAAREISVDVRIIAATHQDLEEMCEQGAFRWDLLYRLTTMILKIPPLRERPEEIAALAEHFLSRTRQEPGAGHTATSLDATALKALQLYDWPGNIRQLRNVIERAVIVTEGPVITVADLPERVRRILPDRETGQEEERGRRTATISIPMPIASIPEELAEAPAPDDDLVVEPRAASEQELGLKERLERLEISLIRNALHKTQGNQTEAAQLLRIPRRTMLHKMKCHGIDGRSWSEAPEDGFPGLTTSNPNGRPLTFKQEVERFEAEVIREALVSADGDHARAARLLRVARHAFVYRARKYGIK